LFSPYCRPKLVTTNTKIEQREKGKERKALAAAQLDRAIEKELLERLRQATEGEIFNYPERQYSRVLNKASNKFQSESGEALVDPDLEQEDEDELEEEMEEEDGEMEAEEEDEEESEEDEKDYNVEYVEVSERYTAMLLCLCVRSAGGALAFILSS
jgi:protein MAK16